MKKRLLFLLIIILGIYIAGLFFIKYQVKNEIEKHPELIYDDVSVGFLGEIEINGVNYDSKTVNFRDGEIDLNLDFLSFINGKQKTINGVKLSHTNIEIFNQKKDSVKPPDNTSVDLIIKKLQFENVNLKIHQTNEAIEIEELNFKINNIASFDDFEIKQVEQLYFSGLKYPINHLQAIQLGALSFKNKIGKLNEIRILPLLTKENYSNSVEKETDLIDLKITSMDFNIEDFKILEGEINELILDHVALDSMVLEVYRDKTLPDDKSIKRSYAQQLKDMNYKFALHQLVLKNAKVIYGEKHIEEKDYALITFDDLGVELDSISNYNSNFARLKSQSSLNENSELKLFITYDLNANQSTFDAKIEARNINAKAFSEMLKHSQKKDVDGKILKLSTEFQSRNNSSSGDFNIEATDLKITLYNDQFEEKKILSFLANNIIKDSINKSFEIKDVQKDPAKSFWNYLWAYIKEGLKMALLK